MGVEAVTCSISADGGIPSCRFLSCSSAAPSFCWFSCAGREVCAEKRDRWTGADQTRKVQACAVHGMAAGGFTCVSFIAVAWYIESSETVAIIRRVVPLIRAWGARCGGRGRLLA